MVSILPLISSSSNLFSRLLGAVQRVPTMTGITVTLMFHNFFISQARSQQFSMFLLFEKDIETRLTKAWTAINRLSIIWKSDLTDKMKRSFFQAAVTSILLYGCTTWTLTKRLEKKLDGNYTRMLRAILNKSWQQHPTRHQLYGHLPPITKTIQVRRTRHAGHCWRSRDELIRDVLLWIPTHGRAKAGRPARTYIQQLCEDTGCCPEDLPRAMNDREEWRERVRDICATSAIWWWYFHPAGMAKSTTWPVLFFLLINTRSGLLLGIESSVSSRIRSIFVFTNLYFKAYIICASKNFLWEYHYRYHYL